MVQTLISEHRSCVLPGNVNSLLMLLGTKCHIKPNLPAIIPTILDLVLKSTKVAISVRSCLFGRSVKACVRCKVLKACKEKKSIEMARHCS